MIYESLLTDDQPEYNIVAFRILSTNPDPHDFMGVNRLYAVAVMVKGQIDDYAVYLAITRHDEEGRVTPETLQVPLRSCDKMPRALGEYLYGDVAERMGLRWRD